MKMIVIGLVLTTLLFIFAAFFLKTSLPYFDPITKVVDDLALCEPVEDKPRYFYDQVVSERLRERDSFVDFMFLFEKNYRGCFEQCNESITFSNGLMFSNKDGTMIKDFYFSDDVCPNIRMNLIKESGVWKVDEFILNDEIELIEPEVLFGR